MANTLAHYINCPFSAHYKFIVFYSIGPVVVETRPNRFHLLVEPKDIDVKTLNDVQVKIVGADFFFKSLTRFSKNILQYSYDISSDNSISSKERA
jgi:hypothetical protein